MERNLEQKNLVSENTVIFIDEQLIGIQDSLNKAEVDLQVFQEGNDFMDLRTQSSEMFNRLKDIERMSEDGTFDVLPKKEVIQIKKEWEKLEKNLGGIKDMTRIPDAIFVVDPKKEKICVQEAHSLGITLIGIGDTNCDPEELDYIIPGNDDAIRAVKLIVAKMADAVIEANQGETAETMEDVEAVAEVEETEEA